MNKILFALPLLVTLFNSTSYSQKSKFSWQYENCYCAGTFDSTKYSRIELQNTVDYMIGFNLIDADATVFKIEDLDKISLEELERECAERQSQMQFLPLIRTAYWDSIKLHRMLEIYDQCEVKRVTLLAYNQPEILPRYDRTKGLCDQYTEPLAAGGQALLKAWKELIELQMTTNVDPNRVYREYERERNSPDSLVYARMEIMTFGWWNCANHTIRYVENDHLMQEEFKKVFRKVKCDCEEY